MLWELIRMPCAWADDSADCALEGEFADGAFFVTKCSGEGIGDGTGQLYE